MHVLRQQHFIHITYNENMNHHACTIAVVVTPTHCNRKNHVIFFSLCVKTRDLEVMQKSCIHICSTIIIIDILLRSCVSLVQQQRQNELRANSMTSTMTLLWKQKYLMIPLSFRFYARVCNIRHDTFLIDDENYFLIE